MNFFMNRVRAIEVFKRGNDVLSALTMIIFYNGSYWRRGRFGKGKKVGFGHVKFEILVRVLSGDVGWAYGYLVGIRCLGLDI